MSDAPTEPTPSSSSHYSSATPPTTPLAPQEPVTPKKRGMSTGATVVVAAVIAAIVGGASGAGIVAAVDSNSTPQVVSSASGPTSITVNDPKTATTITAVAAKASPSIVTINATTSSEAGTGSGVVLTSDGYVLTNNHVVTLDGESADPTIQVETNDGRLFAAKVVGTDSVDDLAVIKLQNVSGLQPAQFADSSKLNVGDTAIAIGAPLGLSGSVTNGIVSALNRSITVASSAAPTSGSGSSGDGSGGSGSGSGSSPFNFWNFGGGSGSGSGGSGSGGSGSSGSSSTVANASIYLSVIQTDAAINPGNSGGALLDSDGKVIGINCAIASASDTSDSSGQSGSIGVGFAIPSNVAIRIADSIMKTGSATHGLLNAEVEDVTTDGSATSSKVVGAKIVSVTSGGAAATAGLKAGDIVTNFNGIPITNSDDLTAQVRALPAGAKTTLTFVRGSSTEKASVTLGQYSNQ